MRHLKNTPLFFHLKVRNPSQRAFPNNKFTNFRKNLFLNASMIERFKKTIGFSRLFRTADIADLIALSGLFRQEAPDFKLFKAQSLEIIRKRRGYRARRLLRGLPMRGQRTHTNAKTRKKRKVE